MVAFAQTLLLILLLAFFVLHLCILIKVIPYKMVWGGKLKTDKDMYRFETFAIFVNFIFIAIVLLHRGILQISMSNNIITIALWIMAALFLFNSIGNFLSKNKIEKWVFTPVTLVMAVCSAILACPPAE